MFTSDDIQVRVRPFVPPRVTTSSGESFEVRHPDLIMVGRRDLTIGRASSENPTQYEGTGRVAIRHVTALEDLPTPSESSGNRHR